MWVKPVVFVLGVVGCSLVLAFGSHPTQPAARLVAGAVHPDTLIATVQIDSLRVVSIVDDAGIEHPVDSTLVPPVPVRGPSEVRIVYRRPAAAEPLAARATRP